MRYIFYILILLTLIGCKKNETFIVNGKIKNKFTNANISDFYIQIQTSVPDGDLSAGIVHDFTYSDNNGNYNFNFNMDVERNFSGDFILWASYPPGHTYDSTINAYKYFSAVVDANKNDFDDSINIYLTPSGLIKFYASNSTWDFINSDSIFIQSSYESKYLIRTTSSDSIVNFHVDASSVSEFKWCYIKNGIQSSLVIKDIFVPNRVAYLFNYTNETFFYEIIF